MIKFEIPGLRSLLESIQGLYQPTNQMFLSEKMKPLQLHQGTFNIHLYIFHPEWVEMEITSRKVTIFDVVAKVSSQSTPSSCAYPLATRQALYLSKEPCDLYLTLKIHLQPNYLFPRDNVDNTQVLFFIYASYFTFMAASDSSFPLYSTNVLGSSTWNKNNRS